MHRGDRRISRFRRDCSGRCGPVRHHRHGANGSHTALARCRRVLPPRGVEEAERQPRGCAATSAATARCTSCELRLNASQGTALETLLARRSAHGGHVRRISVQHVSMILAKQSLCHTELSKKQLRDHTSPTSHGGTTSPHPSSAPSPRCHYSKVSGECLPVSHKRCTSSASRAKSAQRFLLGRSLVRQPAHTEIRRDSSQCEIDVRGRDACGLARRVGQHPDP